MTTHSPLPHPLPFLFLLLLLFTLGGGSRPLPLDHSTTTPTPTTTRSIFIRHTTTPTLTPTTTALPTHSCVLENGTRINNTEDNPIRIIDDAGDIFSCMECHCDVSGPGNGRGGKGQDEAALCKYGECLQPLCVDFVWTERDCCPVCPNGKNCYKPQWAVRDESESNPKQELREMRQKIKECRKRHLDNPPIQRDGKHGQFNDVVVDVHKLNRRLRICKRRYKRMYRERYSKTMRAGRRYRFGNQICRCDYDPQHPQHIINRHSVCKPA
uniref:Capsule gland specific secretory protein n=1 Tax=Reishia bronni TaxID=578817 RepID=A0A6G9KQS5_9CAEN|nr:capsule gland specific secretory protein [Reishia bronni]